MNVVYKAIGELTPYEKNAKKHDQKQIDNVAESLRQFGFVQPVVVDKDGVIVIGHCRVLAAKKLGMKEVPCVSVDELTPEQVQALRIVDNKTNESEWDFDLLAAELPEIDLSAFDFDFDIDDISPDDYGTEFSLPDGDKPETEYMSFVFHRNQKELITAAIESQRGKCAETFGNKNESGNALYEVVRQWATQNGLL